jgi:alanine dehydrogenase
MKIGTIKEVKDHEGRVGLTPTCAMLLKSRGFEVFVESKAGVLSGYSDRDYLDVGAKILPNAIAVAKICDVIAKVKEPVGREFNTWLSEFKGKTLFAFLHLAANKGLARELINNNITGISYDTIEDIKGNIPALKPMSEIAGRASIDLAERYLTSPLEEVVIVGGGVVGEEAARQALLKPDIKRITIFEKREERIKELNFLFLEHYPLVRIKNMEKSLYGGVSDLRFALKTANLLIGAVLVKGTRAPTVVAKEDLEFLVQKNGMIFDIAIDQGGCICGSKVTSYSDPTYVFENKTYCCIPNLPGQRPEEASVKLTEITLSYIEEWLAASEGSRRISEQLLKGINTREGKIANRGVAQDLDMMHHYKELK